MTPSIPETKAFLETSLGFEPIFLSGTGDIVVCRQMCEVFSSKFFQQYVTRILNVDAGKLQEALSTEISSLTDSQIALLRSVQKKTLSENGLLHRYLDANSAITHMKTAQKIYERIVDVLGENAIAEGKDRSAYPYFKHPFGDANTANYVYKCKLSSGEIMTFPLAIPIQKSALTQVSNQAGDWNILTPGGTFLFNEWGRVSTHQTIDARHLPEHLKTMKALLITRLASLRAIHIPINGDTGEQIGDIIFTNNGTYMPETGKIYKPGLWLGGNQESIVFYPPS